LPGERDDLAGVGPSVSEVSRHADVEGARQTPLAADAVP
jgi:hypothetical protein